MGVYLSTPELSTDGDFGTNDFFTYASCSMQGWRSSQEDDCLAISEANEFNSSAMFAVFDGHGGSSVAKFCALHFLEYLNETGNFKDGNPKMNEILKELFLHCDEQVAKAEVRKELEELSAADSDEEVGSSDGEDELEETTLEDKEKEIEDLCEEATEPLEKVVEKLGGEDQLPEESKQLLEQRRKSSIRGDKLSSSKTDAEDEKEKEENGEEEEESDDDSDYVPPEDDTPAEENGEDKGKGPGLFKALSKQFETENIPGMTSGCTACAMVLLPDLTTKGVRLFVANAGDSRAVLSRNGKAIDLSCDHKPETKCEKDRISAAGGVISEDGRVNGGLNLSRAIGDHTYKQREDLSLADQMITANPDVTDTLLDPEQDQFAVIACDGVWNVMTSQEVVDFVAARMKDPSLIGQERKPYSMFKEVPEESESDDEVEDEAEAKNGEKPDKNGDKKEDEEEEKAEDDDKEEEDIEEEEDDEFVDEEVEFREGPGMLKEIATDLFHACLSPTTTGDGTGCDNMTCIIIKFDNLAEYAKKAKVECGPVVEVTLPENDETEVIERRKRTHSGDSSVEASSSEAEEEEPASDEAAGKHPKKKFKQTEAEQEKSNGDTEHERVQQNGVH